MDGTQAASARPPLPTETVTLSYADSARLLAPAVARVFESQGFVCRSDPKLHDPGSTASPATLRNIQESAVLCLLLGARCRQGGWHDAEAAAAAFAGKPVLVLTENRHIEWAGRCTPSLLTSDPARLAAFAANSRPDAVTLWEFARQFFIDRSTARSFHRAASGAWRWQRAVQPAKAASLELSLEETAVDYTPPCVEITLVEARAEAGMPVLLIGTADGKRHRFAYSREVRAVLPAPVFPGAPVIGFMHMDFDSGREWPRAGEAPVEVRLLGREVYGWHMSEYFWRAFVGSLPKLLGAR